MSNIYQKRNRRIKVLALSSLLAGSGITLDLAKGMSDSDWSLAAECAKVNEPSSQTKRAVLAKIGRRDWVGQAVIALQIQGGLL